MRLKLILFFVLILGPISWVIPEIYLSTLVLGTGFPHIILGAKYSKRGLEIAFSNFWQKALLLILIPISLFFGIKYGAIGLVFYFALHHSLSETYSHKSLFQNNGIFNLTYGTVILSSFLVACRSDYMEYKFLFLWVYLLFSGSFLGLLIVIRKNFSSLKSTKLLFFNHPWILGAPLLTICSLINPISWNVLILYHFLFWALLPLFRKEMFEGNQSKLKIFWTEAKIFYGFGILAMSLLAWFSINYVDFRLFQLTVLSFYILTYWHISVSFIISGANPSFIKNIFIAKSFQD